MRKLLYVFAAMCIVGCGNDVSNSVSPTTSLNGVWNLQAINGTQLPYSESNGTDAVTVNSSSLTLSPDGTYNEIVYYTVQSGGALQNSSATEYGEWSAVNGAITFFDETDGVQYSASVSGNTLTEISGGYTEVYTKQ